MTETKGFVPEGGSEFRKAEIEHIKPDCSSIEITRHGGSWDQTEKGSDENAGLIKKELLEDNIAEIKAKVAGMNVDADTYTAIFSSDVAYREGDLPEEERGKGKTSRALQTAELYRSAFLEEYSKLGLPTDEHMIKFSSTEGGDVRKSPRISEWDGWNVDATWFALAGGRNEYGEEDPTVLGYPTHRERLDAINNGDLTELSKRVGTETPEEMGENLKKFLHDIGSWATFWHEANPGKKLQVVVVTHGERIRKFKDMALGGEDFDPKPNQGFTLNIDKEGETTIEIDGQTLEVDIDNPLSKEK